MDSNLKRSYPRKRETSVESANLCVYLWNSNGVNQWVGQRFPENEGQLKGAQREERTELLLLQELAGFACDSEYDRSWGPSDEERGANQNHGPENALLLRPFFVRHSQSVLGELRSV
jgi:hypothetical protein